MESAVNIADTDHAYLRYNGERVLGPKKIDDGESLTVNVVRDISGQATVDLFDDDWPDSDDHLGSITILEDELGQRQRSQNLRGHGARYTLFYTVE